MRRRRGAYLVVFFSSVLRCFHLHLFVDRLVLQPHHLRVVGHSRSVEPESREGEYAHVGGTGRGREGQAKVKRERTGIVVKHAKDRHEKHLYACDPSTPWSGRVIRATRGNRGKERTRRNCAIIKGGKKGENERSELGQRGRDGERNGRIVGE